MIKPIMMGTILFTSSALLASRPCAAADPSPPAGRELIIHRDSTVPALPTEEDHRRGFQLFSRHWMDAVYETTVPPRRAPLISLEMFAAPSEYEPAAFGLHALADLAEISLSAAPLMSDQGDQLPVPELRIARSLPFGWGSDSTALLVPVILEKRRGYTIVKDTSRLCWFTVHVPAGSKPGMYHSQITISVAGDTAATVPLNVEVLALKLASANELDQSYGFWTWHFEEPPEFCPDPVAAFKDMRAHGMNSTTFGTDENIAFRRNGDNYIRALDGTSWDEFLRAAKQADFAQPVLVHIDDIARNAGQVHPYTGGMEGKAIILNENPAFEALFCQGITQIMAEFKRHGLPEPIFGIGDEMQPYEQYTHGYLDRLIHRAGGTTFANGVGPFPADSVDWRADAIRMTDIIMPGCALDAYHGRTLYGFPENVLLARQQGKRMMTYNYGSLILPVQANWRFGMGFFFESLGKGCEGQFVHAYYSIYDDPYNLLDYGGYAERCAVFPPIPERDEVGGPTINYESMREGIDDMRYISTLKRLIGQARKAGRHAEADTARQTLDAIVGSLNFSVFYANVRAWKELTPGISFFERTSPSFDPIKSGQTNETWPEPLKYVEGVLRYPCGWTNQDFDDARWTIAQEIVRLQKACRARLD